MKQIIYRDIKKMVCSLRFWAMIGIVVVTTIISRFPFSINTSLGVFDLFIQKNIVDNSIMRFLAPFIPALAFGPIILDDLQNKTFKKVSLKKYVMGKAVFSVIAGGGVFLLSFLIILGICFICSPLDVMSNYTPMGLFKSVYYYSVPLYILLFILHSMLFGMEYTLFGMGIELTSHDSSMALVLPGIVYNCARLLGTFFYNTALPWLRYLFPFLTYEFGSLDISLWRSSLDMGIMLIASAGLIAWGSYKLKKSNVISIFNKEG